jgi:DNA-binding SARP family transcriptional activator
MPLRIRLLGPPGLERDGTSVRLEGRKTWALLAFLVLASGPTTRRELVDRLWSEADDPLGALRWALSRVRKIIAPDVEIRETDSGLTVHGAVSVDALDLLDGRWDETTVIDLARGEMLEGADFHDAPEFARWLDVQRARLASATTEALRSCAAIAGRSDPDRALLLAERALKAEPFDDALHELIVDIHVARGDGARARSYVDLTTARYLRELGTEPPAGLLRALERTPTSARPLLSLDTQARALLELANSRSVGSDWDGAADLALRAAKNASTSGDGALESRALVAAVNYMTLCTRGSPREWLAMLHRALTLANSLGDDAVVCDIEVERGRIAGMQATYGAAEAALRRAMAIARKLGDRGRASFARRFLGIFESDRCDFVAAEADLRAATDGARAPEVALAWLTRTLVRVERYDEANELADECIAGMRAKNLVLQLPLAILAKADVALARGAHAAALDLFGQAFIHADTQGDPDWTALALRGLARVDRAEGRPARAATALRDALARATSRPGCYRWVEAVILTDLIEWDEGDPMRLQRALRLAHTGPMPDLARRLGKYVPPHTPAHTLAS